RDALEIGRLVARLELRANQRQRVALERDGVGTLRHGCLLRGGVRGRAAVPPALTVVTTGSAYRPAGQSQTGRGDQFGLKSGGNLRSVAAGVATRASRRVSSCPARRTISGCSKSACLCSTGNGKAKPRMSQRAPSVSSPWNSSRSWSRAGPA